MRAPATPSSTSFFRLDVGFSSYHGSRRLPGQREHQRAIDTCSIAMPSTRMPMTESVEAGIVDVEISGPDADRLLALGAQVRSLFQAAPGIRDNDDDWGNKILKVVIDINQDRVRQLGDNVGRNHPDAQDLFQRICGLDLSRR